MMEAGTITYSLELPGFFIDFDVKKESSLAETAAYHLPDCPDFVFAVADTWLRLENSRHLIASEFHTDNLIETLRTLAARLRTLISMPVVEKIPRGGWCEWMDGYWNRLKSDCSTPEDEVIYDLLIPMSVMESREGYVAAYLYNREPILEVAARPESEHVPVSVWCTFNPERLALEVDALRGAIAQYLRMSD
jgi:hypothetical protein